MPCRQTGFTRIACGLVPEIDLICALNFLEMQSISQLNLDLLPRQALGGQLRLFQQAVVMLCVV